MEAGPMEEPKGIRRAELADQISEVQLPELFWDGRGAEEHQGMNLKSLEVKRSGILDDSSINGEGQEACWGEVRSGKWFAGGPCSAWRMYGNAHAPMNGSGW